MRTIICLCLFLTLSVAASAAPVPPGGSGNEKVHYQMDVCGLHKSVNKAPTGHTLEYDKVRSLHLQGTYSSKDA